MLPLEHSAILLTFIKLPFVNKNFVLSILSGRLRLRFYCIVGITVYGLSRTIVTLARSIEVCYGPGVVSALCHFGQRSILPWVISA